MRHREPGSLACVADRARRGRDRERDRQRQGHHHASPHAPPPEEAPSVSPRPRRRDALLPLPRARHRRYKSPMRARLREPRRLKYGALTVLHDPVPGPLTAIALVVRAGSRFDGAHPGIAHMTEHMLFQGTRALDQVALNRRAAELGGEHDADTGYEDVTL
ncbi:MAG: insulinase family protein, partial [Deltaproteobacteria bacterium]